MIIYFQAAFNKKVREKGSPEKIICKISGLLEA